MVLHHWGHAWFICVHHIYIYTIIYICIYIWGRWKLRDDLACPGIKTRMYLSLWSMVIPWHNEPVSVRYACQRFVQSQWLIRHTNGEKKIFPRTHYSFMDHFARNQGYQVWPHSVGFDFYSPRLNIDVQREGNWRSIRQIFNKMDGTKRWWCNVGNKIARTCS